uniref:Uncharacterized protein n=1 Tax=viral metagenome TaxID=1070528 RepID=A0A6M3IPC4_9ZZZZ
MFTEIGDIRSAISTFQNDTSHLYNKSRWQQDFDLYRIKPFNAGHGYPSYTTNFPRVYANKVIAMITMAKLLIHLPDEIMNAQERNVANNVERFLYGSFNLNDERNALLPGVPSIRGQKAFYGAVRGGYATLTYVYKNEAGKTCPDVYVWDIYNVSYGQSDEGVPWATHTYKASSTRVKKEYHKDYAGKSGLVDVIDYWDTEKYGVIINNEWAKPLEPHGLDHCPVHVFKVGDLPPIWQDNYEQTGAYIGESIFAPIREIVPTLNKLMSDYLTIIRRGVRSPLGYWSATGTKTIDEDIWQTEKPGTVSLQFGEEIKPVFQEVMPKDAATFLNWIMGEVQRGSLPYTAFGELGFRLSGFAINQLMGSLETVINPLSACIAQSYRLESQELLQQYATGGFTPVEVRGRTSKNLPFGYPKAARIKPSDIQGEWHPEVSLVPVLPKDDAQKFAMANMARQGETPLLSLRTIRTDILDIQDADLEESNVKYEWADNLTINKLYDAYLRAIENGRPDIAANILTELQRLMGGQPTGRAKPSNVTGVNNSGLVMAAAGTPGVGIPTSSGMSPEALPSESMGGLPGGSLNAQMPLFGEET